MPTLGLTAGTRCLIALIRGYRGVQPQSAPRESSLGKPDVSIQRKMGKKGAGFGVSHAGAARTPSSGAPQRFAVGLRTMPVRCLRRIAARIRTSAMRSKPQAVQPARNVTAVAVAAAAGCLIKDRKGCISVARARYGLRSAAKWTRELCDGCGVESGDACSFASGWCIRNARGAQARGGGGF